MNDQRVYLYAFLSRVMSDQIDPRFVSDLRNNSALLEIIGSETGQWFDETSDEVILEALNIDYTSMFVLNTQPVESFVLDAKSESLVGLQNPVMAFYHNHGFELNMNQTTIVAPDHLGIEFGFMQALAYRGEMIAQREFMEEHLMQWVIPYMMGMKAMAETPFYMNICELIIEFLVTDYAEIMKATHDG